MPTAGKVDVEGAGQVGEVKKPLHRRARRAHGEVDVGAVGDAAQFNDDVQQGGVGEVDGAGVEADLRNVRSAAGLNGGTSARRGVNRGDTVLAQLIGVGDVKLTGDDNVPYPVSERAGEDRRHGGRVTAAVSVCG